MKNKFCYRPFTWLSLGEDDFYHVCCHAWLPMRMGKLNENPIEVWNGDPVQQMRASVLDGSFRYCNDHCPYLREPNARGPVQLVDQIEDPFALDIIENKKVIIDTKPSTIHLNNDRSCQLTCPQCRDKIIMANQTSSRETQVAEMLMPEAGAPNRDHGESTIHVMCENQDTANFVRIKHW